MTSAVLKNSELLSQQEYFSLEEEQGERFEYVCDEIFEMAGCSERHILVSSNSLVEFTLQLRNKPCQVYGSDMKLYLQ